MVGNGCEGVPRDLWRSPKERSRQARRRGESDKLFSWDEEADRGSETIGVLAVQRGCVLIWSEMQVSACVRNMSGAAFQETMPYSGRTEQETKTHIDQSWEE